MVSEHRWSRKNSIQEGIRSLLFGIRSQVLITSISPMAFYSLRPEYALGGNSNYIAWKDRMEAVLEDNGIKEFIDQDVPKPIDATQVAAWKNNMARARRIILEGV